MSSESAAPVLPKVDANIEPKLAEWYASDHCSTWLSNVLATPEGKLLLDVLLEKAVPKTSTESLYVPEGPGLLERLALSQASHSGIYQATALIRGLSRIPEVLPDLRQPWEHYADSAK